LFSFVMIKHREQGNEIKKERKDDACTWSRVGGMVDKGERG